MADAPTEHTLLAGCLAGDRSLQEAFVRHYTNLVFSTIHGVLRSKAACLSQMDIEDLHSTVFLRLMERRCRKLRQYQGRNGCSLASWVRMITVRLVLDHLRSTKDALARPEQIEPLTDHFEIPWDGPSPLVRLTTREQQAFVETGLQALSNRDQLMIRLHFFEGCSLSQVARILNLTDANVHSVKHRAVQRLKEAVARRAAEMK